MKGTYASGVKRGEDRGWRIEDRSTSAISVVGGAVGGVDDGEQVEHAGDGGVEGADLSDSAFGLNVHVLRIFSGLIRCVGGSDADRTGEDLPKEPGALENARDDRPLRAHVRRF